MPIDIVQRARNEPQTVELIRIERNTAADSWLHGFAAGFKNGDVNLPPSHQVEYLRGFIEGLRSSRRD